MLATRLDPINRNRFVRTLALAVTLCLWWLYFRGEPIAQRHVAAAEDRIYAVRIARTGLC
jgi:hypothetical protein